MPIRRTRFTKGIELTPEDLSAEDLSREGELAYDSDDDKLKYRNSSATKEVVDTDETQTLENKTIDATSATGNNTISADADDITYDNSTSSLAATNTQAAIDEVEGRVDASETALSDHLADAVDAHDASAISNAPSGNLASTDVQSALNELQTDIDTRATEVDLQAHITDATASHAASSISNAPSGNLAATDVQAALNELQTDVDTRATSTELTDHINDATDAHAASAITNTPAGNLVATTVQGALDELQTDIDTRATSTDLSNHEADTSTHGVTEIVGTSEAQVITNKDIDGGTASNTNRITVPSDTKANLDALTRKAGTLVYATDQQAFYYDNGTSLVTPAGSAALTTSTIITTTTLTPGSSDIIICETPTTSYTVNLPTAVGNAGLTFYLKKPTYDARNVIIEPAGAELIDGNANFYLVGQSEVQIVSNGSAWNIVNVNINYQLRNQGTLHSAPISSSVYGIASSLTLTPGTWVLNGAYETRNNGPGNPPVNIYWSRATISTTSTLTAFPENLAGRGTVFMTTQTDDRKTVYVERIVTITNTTTFHLLGTVTITNVTNIFSEDYRFSAQRIR